MLTELGDQLYHVFHYVRGGKVFLFSAVLGVVYVGALLAGASHFRHRGTSYFSSLGDTARFVQPYTLAAALVVVGVTQAATYISIAFDDQVRFWSIADVLARGEGYPIREFAGVYWIEDMPAWPVLMLAGFALFGHTTAGTYAPLIAANALMPIVAFLAVRRICGNAVVAFGVAVSLVLFPMYQIYALGAAEPEPIFHLLLLGMVASVPRSQSWPHWVLFGLITAAMILARPEGRVYAVAAFIVLAIAHWREREFWLSAAVAATPPAVYAYIMWLQIGEIWTLRSLPLGYSLDNLRIHWHHFSSIGAQHYSDQLRTTILGFWLILGGAVALFLAGTVHLALQRSVFLFVPLAAGANLFLMWLLDHSQMFTSALLPTEFFRHMSHALPFSAIAIGLGLSAALGFLRSSWQQWALILFFSFVAYHSYQVLLSLESFAEPTNSLFQPGPMTTLLRTDTYVLAWDIFAHPYPLPEISYVWRDGVLFPVFPGDYMAFREKVFEFYQPFDMKGIDIGRPYTLASFYAAVFGFFTLALATIGDRLNKKCTERSGS